MSTENELMQIKMGDLYALLSVCNQEELDPIVEILVQQKTCSLESMYTYKKYFPDHTKYHQVIADEICLFGGNTIVNKIRKTKAVDYSVVVFDVCERLAVPCKKNETIKNENTLLKLLALEENKKTFKVNPLKDILLKVPLGPIAIAGPAYRVLVPCVILIAELRNKKINEFDSELQSNHNNVTPVKTAIVTQNNGVSLQSDSGEVAFSLMQIPNTFDAQTWKNISESDQEISKLNPLLQVVPALITAQDVNSTKYMEVVINGPLIKAKSFLEDGAFRAITNNENGQFKESAHLFDPANLSKIVSASALFHIVSIAVAQKHLADISKKLTEIKATLETIAEFQQVERESKILAAITYFGQVASSVIGGELSHAILHQIEAKETELLAIQNHLLSDILNFNTHFEIKNNSMFGTGGTFKEIQSKQEQVKRLYNQVLLCIRARACGWQLLSLYPNNLSLVKNRKETLQSELQKLGGNGTLVKETKKVINEHIMGLSSKFNSKFTRDIKLNERKFTLLDLNESIFSGITLEKMKIEQEVEHAESFATELEQPIAKILVQVENNKIVATNFI